MMAMFSLEGPFVVPVTKGAGGRRIGKDNVRDFWCEHEELADDVGCYVFGIRAAKGYRPWYVGKATKNFRHEVFAPHKLSHHYNEVLIHTGKGTPVIFLAALERAKGRAPTNQIDNLETFLIQTAVRKNSELSNIQKRKEARWELKGVIRSKRGSSTKESVEFKKLMGL